MMFSGWKEKCQTMKNKTKIIVTCVKPYLEITMYESMLVHVVQSLHDGLDRKRGLGFRISLLFDDAIEKFTTLQRFQHQVHVCLVLVRIEKLHNVGMVAALQDKNLGSNALQAHVCST
jgi:hypothetical protein